MNALKKLQLDFIPKSPDLATLILRVALGAQMLIGHGWGKLSAFEQMAAGFPDPLGVGPRTSLILAIFGECVCSVLLIAGLFTRAAAVGSMVTMTVAFGLVHGWRLSGEGNGEMAFLYLVGFVAVFLIGGARFSLDAKLENRPR